MIVKVQAPFLTQLQKSLYCFNQIIIFTSFFEIKVHVAASNCHIKGKVRVCTIEMIILNYPMFRVLHLVLSSFQFVYMHQRMCKRGEKYQRSVKWKWLSALVSLGKVRSWWPHVLKLPRASYIDTILIVLSHYRRVRLLVLFGCLCNSISNSWFFLISSF